jgi:4-hydroxy-tetrahydrodipicolinate reductase
MTRRLAIVGMGKMGQAIAELAPSRGWDVVARLGAADVAAGLTRTSLGNAEVAVEFTVPRAAPANIRAIVATACPVVCGTTGWYDALDAIRRDVNSQNGSLLTAPNFSIGVNVFERVVEVASRLLGHAGGFEAHLIETHHSTKKDAPSGTARTLATTASAAWGKGKDIPIASIRVGSYPGTHEVVFDAPFETIHLEHIARDRRVFAEGALAAAGWLIGRRGVFTMQDVLATPAGNDQ